MAPTAKGPRWDGPGAKAEAVPVVIHEKNATSDLSSDSRQGVKRFSAEGQRTAAIAKPSAH